MRGIDHLVLPVHDLGAARNTFERLGFTATPDALHPFGTGNFLIQMQGCFLELIAVVEPEKLQLGDDGRPSFGMRVRDHLEKYGEGFNGLVLDSRSAETDRSDFLERGLDVYPPFSFERTAKGPDGEDRKVAFSLTILSDPASLDQTYFTCAQHYPENFWKPDYQAHVNTARSVGTVMMVCADPARHLPFISAFTGSSDIASSPGRVDIATARGTVALIIAEAFEAACGISAFSADTESRQLPQFCGYEILIDDLDATRECLRSGGFATDEHAGSLVIAPDQVHGSAIIFTGQ